MKKTILIAAVAIAAGLASCTAQSPKANLKNEVDSLSYAIGMARTQGLEQYLAQQGVDSTQMADFLKGFKEGAAMVGDEDVAYMMGLQIGQNVSKQWVEGFNQQIFGSDSTKTISREDLLAGFIAGVVGDHKTMNMDEAQAYSTAKTESIKEKALLERYAENKEAGEKFLAENKQKEGVVTTPSGLQYKVITQGKGAIPEKTDKVKVNYRGTLIDGTEFDSSYKRKDKDGNSQPATFRANQVIKGWTEALTLMPVGSKWELYIPQELAYGSRETGAQIKPFSALIFEVELVGIDEEKKK
ncbi:MAG: FKBP-type peptidyl-prolyl cis-trans isomerase [Bacteroides sp.]|nr:FKBP-type peptidyl-prolyl cis-trans isomerase [Bacteroides sp.]